MNEQYKQAAIDNIKRLHEGLVFMSCKHYMDITKDTEFTKWKLEKEGIYFNDLKKLAGLPVSPIGNYKRHRGHYKKRDNLLIKTASKIKERYCLKCDIKFMSVGIGNRLCPAHNKSNLETSEDFMHHANNTAIPVSNKDIQAYNNQHSFINEG